MAGSQPAPGTLPSHERATSDSNPTYRMTITRQLRLAALAADGTAPIYLPITWEGNRLRLGTGAVVRPEHWDAEAR